VIGGNDVVISLFLSPQHHLSFQIVLAPLSFWQTFSLGKIIFSFYTFSNIGSRTVLKNLSRPSILSHHFIQTSNRKTICATAIDLQIINN